MVHALATAYGFGVSSDRPLAHRARAIESVEVSRDPPETRRVWQEDGNGPTWREFSWPRAPWIPARGDRRGHHTP